jgi:FkbM family methyltransferase
MSIKITFLKNLLKSLLVALLGYQNYLYLTCCYRIKVFKYSRRGIDFLYFTSIIPPDSVVFDIGANTGYTTYFLALNNNLLVESFEPEPNNLKVLRKIVSKYANVKVHDIAVGNYNEICKLITPVIANFKAHQLPYVYQEGDSYPNNYTVNYIKIKRLDDMPEFEHLARPLSAVRISVQGFEYLVIMGIEKLIIKYRPIIYCDIWEMKNKINIFNFLNKINYGGFVLYRGRLISADIADNNLGNFYFIPK